MATGPHLLVRGISVLLVKATALLASDKQTTPVYILNQRELLLGQLSNLTFAHLTHMQKQPRVFHRVHVAANTRASK